MNYPTMSVIITKEDFEAQYSKDPEVQKTRRKPHIIRDYDIIKVKDLKVGQIFYPDFDVYVFFGTTNKRYVEQFVEDGAIVQTLHKNEDGSWGFNMKTKYNLDDDAFIQTGEHISVH